MSGTKVMAQKTFYPQIQKNQKMHESPTGGFLQQAITPRQKMLASYTSPQKTHEVFLFAPKKNILDLGSGFSVGGV